MRGGGDDNDDVLLLMIIFYAPEEEEEQVEADEELVDAEEFEAEVEAAFQEEELVRQNRKRQRTLPPPPAAGRGRTTTRSSSAAAVPPGRGVVRRQPAPSEVVPPGLRHTRMPSRTRPQLPGAGTDAYPVTPPPTRPHSTPPPRGSTPPTISSRTTTTTTHDEDDDAFGATASVEPEEEEGIDGQVMTAEEEAEAARCDEEVEGEEAEEEVVAEDISGGGDAAADMYAIVPAGNVQSLPDGRRREFVRRGNAVRRNPPPPAPQADGPAAAEQPAPDVWPSGRLRFGQLGARRIPERTPQPIQDRPPAEAMDVVSARLAKAASALLMRDRTRTPPPNRSQLSLSRTAASFARARVESEAAAMQPPPVPRQIAPPEPEEEEEPPPSPGTVARRDYLKRVVAQQNDEADRLCQMCSEELFGGDETMRGPVVKMPYCNHRFHEACIAQWMASNKVPFERACPHRCAPSEARVIEEVEGPEMAAAREESRLMAIAAARGADAGP